MPLPFVVRCGRTSSSRSGDAPRTGERGKPWEAGRSWGSGLTFHSAQAAAVPVELNPLAVGCLTKSQRLEVEFDATTVSYFERQGCVRRADMAAAAATALRELALRTEVDALATFLNDHPDYVAVSDDEYDAALAELPTGGLYSP